MLKIPTYALMQNLCNHVHNKKQPLRYQKRRFYTNLCTYARKLASVKILMQLMQKRRIIFFNYIYFIYYIFKDAGKVA